MTASEVLNPDGNRLHQFLHASVGQDARGAEVTVLSALARLGLDPWAEAEDLSALGRNAALARIDRWLGQVFDVAALSGDRTALARHLAGLLPGPKSAPVRATISAVTVRAPRLNVGLLIAFAILVAFLLPIVFGSDFGIAP